MSFSPLPAIFLEDLALIAGRPALEAGCGDGRFSALLAARGARPWRLDRRPPWRGSVADVVADARDLPLADGSIALLVCANLLRHLWSARGPEAVPEGWRRCLAPDGCLWIFEDEPVSSPPAARNYREAMTLLARLDPEGRRPLLSLGGFLARLDDAGLREGWRHGMAVNESRVEDPEALARLLAGRGGGPEAPGVRLAAAIRRDGISYGPFWWARWSREAAA